MNNLETKRYDFNFNKSLIPNRLSVALSSYRLNEFYASFKYFKSIIIYIFDKNNNDIQTIKEAYLQISKTNNINKKTLITAIGKLLKHLPTNFFNSCPLINKIKMNCFHKTQYIVDVVAKDIQNFDHKEK